MSPQREILDSLSFETVWQSLDGGPMVGRGDNRRARAFWRNGDGLSVAVDLRRKLWKDHKTGDGGGLVDLVTTAKCWDRGSAWEFLSMLSGVPLRQVSREESQRYRREMASAETEAKQIYRQWAAAVDTLAAYTNCWFKLYHALRDEFWNSSDLSAEQRIALRAEVESAWAWYSILRQQQDTLIGADPKKLIRILRNAAKTEAA